MRHFNFDDIGIKFLKFECLCISLCLSVINKEKNIHHFHIKIISIQFIFNYLFVL